MKKKEILKPKQIQITKNETMKPKLSRGRKRSIITACEHISYPHYAKGMCNGCYHSLGRTQKAYNCAH